MASSSSSSYRDWAWLPRNLLCSILEKVDQFSDYVRFSAVCVQWRHVALEDINDHHDHEQHKQRFDILRTCHNKLPMLMTGIEEENNQEKRVLFSVTAEEGIWMTYRLQLPLPCNKVFFGSSFGWLFTVEKNMSITLVNPFIPGSSVSLPVFHDSYGQFNFWMDDGNQDYFLTKGILSSDPFLSTDNIEVVVLYGGSTRFAFLRSGDHNWNFINMEPDNKISDVIYHKGLVHAVTWWSELAQIDTANGTYRLLVTKKSDVCSLSTYLVESQEGDLLLVERILNRIRLMLISTETFKVFKLVHSNIGEEEHATWVETKNIGDQALFVGDNHAVSVSTLEFPQCQPNCIYYTFQNLISRYFHEFHDSGVFNLEDGSFRSHYIPDSYKKHILNPMWYVPYQKGN